MELQEHEAHVGLYQDVPLNWKFVFTFRQIDISNGMNGMLSTGSQQPDVRC